MTQPPVVLIGAGEMGGVFAHGLLRAGHPVHPVTRGMAMAEVADAYPEPALALVTVGESDLHPVLADIPAPWRDRLGLIQNELLPRDWEAHDLPQPTASAVWFEKKPGKPVNPIIASPVYGPNAGLLVNALQAIDIPARVVEDDGEMLFELVRKNVYILTTNIAGLITGGTTGELWHHHRELAQQVADEIMTVQAWLTGAELDRERLVAGAAEAMLADPEHGNTGRSAPARLKRAIGFADEAGLAVPKLREIAAEHAP
jgi:ketopantoate reductase